MPRELPPRGNNMIMGGEGGSFVTGENLKQADVPIETLLGAGNGLVKGAVISGGASALVSIAQGERELGPIFKKMYTTHLWPVVAGTAAFIAINALVRNSRARKHNEWVDRHYAFMEQQDTSHAGRVQNERLENTQTPQGKA